MPCRTPGDALRPHRRPAGGLDADQLGRRAHEAGRKCRPRCCRPPRRRRRNRGPCRASSGIAGSRLFPMTAWNSRTIHGNGCGPITEPRQ